MIGKMKWMLLAGSAVPLFGWMTTVAVAQTQPDVALPRADAMDPDIVVTARRTAESIQSVPVSVTAFSAESLSARSIKTTEDLQLATPGVFLSGVGGRQNVNYAIRGQSKAVSGLSSPGVVSYFAEVPDPVQGSATPQYDMASIQILKGPQGTLFGRNTTGGAILFYPATPTYELSGSIEATYGTFDNRQLQAVVNLPIIANKIAIRVAGDYQKRDGYTKELGAGKDLDNVNSRAFRVSLLVSPVETIKNTTIFDYYKNDDNGQAAILYKVGSAPSILDLFGLRSAVNAQYAAQQARGPYVTNNSFPQSQHVKRTSLINRTEIELGGVTLINIFGYRSTHWTYLTDTDGMPIIAADGTGLLPAGTPVEYLVAGANSNTHQLSDELQLEGKLLDGKLSWLVGGFYLKSKPSGPNASLARAFQVVGTAPTPTNYAFLTEESKALFGHIEYDLGGVVEGLKFNGGFRYSWDKFKACTATGLNGQFNDVNPDDCVASNPLLARVSTNTAGSSAPTWTIGLDWQASPDLFTYIVSRRGYRSGGINGPTFSGRLIPFQTFGPETVTDIEVGVRSDWHLGGDVKLRLNASAYSGWYNKVQGVITGLRTSPTCNPAINNPAGISPDGDCDPTNDPAALTLLANIGKSRVSGVDFDGNIWFTRNLQVNFGGSYISTKTRSLDAPAALLPYIPTKSIPFNNTPKYTVLAGLSYTRDLPDNAGSVSFRADYYHSARVRYSTDFIPGYNVVNSRIEWNNILSSGLDLAVFARNLFKEKYVASTNLSTASIAILTVTYGTPRTFGVTGRYRF
jgi:iron complex outermembrane receptor protein